MKSSFETLCEGIGFLVLLCVAWKVLAPVFTALYGSYHQWRYGYEPPHDNKAAKAYIDELSRQVHEQNSPLYLARLREAQLEDERKREEERIKSDIAKIERLEAKLAIEQAELDRAAKATRPEK